MKKAFFLFILISLFTLSLINAQPSFVTGENTQGFIILESISSSVKLNENQSFAIHVINISSGYPKISGISCYGHLYKEGHHIGIYETKTTEHLLDYELEFDKGNFSEKGEYILKSSCNDSLYGGAAEVYFYATTYGDIPAEGNFKIFIYSLFVICFLGTIFYLILSLLNFIMANQTVFGVLSSWIFYLGLVLVNYLAKAYLLDYFIENITQNMITWGGFPLILVPLISLFWTMTKKGFEKKKPLDPNELTGRKFFFYG